MFCWVGVLDVIGVITVVTLDAFHIVLAVRSNYFLLLV